MLQVGVIIPAIWRARQNSNKSLSNKIWHDRPIAHDIFGLVAKGSAVLLLCRRSGALPNVRMARHIDVRRPEPHRLRARSALSYRACEFTAGVGGWPAIIGGLSIPYATIPMNRMTGITIGGTRYFMVFPLLGEPYRRRITIRVIAVQKSARQTSSLKYNIVSFAMITRRCVISIAIFQKHRFAMTGKI
jgi:hypothetical protein